jgi:hypothetical protein
MIFTWPSGKGLQLRTLGQTRTDNATTGVVLRDENPWSLYSAKLRDLVCRPTVFIAEGNVWTTLSLKLPIIWIFTKGEAAKGR